MSRFNFVFVYRAIGIFIFPRPVYKFVINHLHGFRNEISNLTENLFSFVEEAMNRIKQTFIFDKTLQCEVESFESTNNTRQLGILTNFEKRFIQSASTSGMKKESHNRSLITIKSLYNNKMDFLNY